MSTDPFRYCIYCGEDCYLDEPDHAADCPLITGVRPVRPEDQILCPHCGKDIHGPALCSDCNLPLEVGDHYILRDVDSPSGGSMYEPICVGCAARQSLLAESEPPVTLE